mmetsp:Transcript_17058/g.19156  ORF Transcript_17058/g.19156 Transcript_17058/m.19156 type:complete len:160 (-) Transcript_17058:1512-1991(-)
METTNFQHLWWGRFSSDEDHLKKRKRELKEASKPQILTKKVWGKQVYKRRAERLLISGKSGSNIWIAFIYNCHTSADMGSHFFLAYSDRCPSTVFVTFISFINHRKGICSRVNIILKNTASGVISASCIGALPQTWLGLIKRKRLCVLIAGKFECAITT